jgi:hypothetical protein
MVSGFKHDPRSTENVLNPPQEWLKYISSWGMPSKVQMPVACRRVLRNPIPRASLKHGLIPCFRRHATSHEEEGASALSPLQTSTSKRTSNTTGTPSGRLAMPRTIRTGNLSSPKTSRNSSEAASATFGCAKKPPSVARFAISLTTLVTLSSEPRWFLAAESTFRACDARGFASCSTLYSLPSRPANFGLCPMTVGLGLGTRKAPLGSRFVAN